MIKPMIVRLSSATGAIQFTGGPKIPNVPETDPTNPLFSSGGAYRLDE